MEKGAIVMELRVLTVGDVCGEAGLKYACANLKRLRRELGADFCVVNGETPPSWGSSPSRRNACSQPGRT